MKTLTLLCLMSIISSRTIVAMTGPGIPERIQKLFRKEFPTVENPVFVQTGTTYVVYFNKSNSWSERVFYNLDAEMVKTIKYYTENELDPMICERVNSKYKGKTIIRVTEVFSATAHFYRIILQGDKHWYIIKSDTNGSMKIQKRWNGKAETDSAFYHETK